MKKLKDYKRERLFTHDEFAAYLEVAPDTLYRIMRGDKPAVKTMRKIAGKLKVKATEIEDFEQWL